MTSPNGLAFAIIEHLCSQLESGAVTGDSAESLEVAIQCLEQVYNIDKSDPTQRTQMGTDQTLQEIYNDATKTSGGSTSAQATTDYRTKGAEKTEVIPPEVKAEAEKLKVKANQLMKEENYEEAIECYTKSMELDSTNAIFPCNRAAAYSKLGDHSKAVDDCKRAIAIDPTYGKAYGRLGLSYQSMNDFAKARDNYVKAVELEPGNTFYQNNLAQVEVKIRETPSQQSSAPQGGAGGAPNLGGLDFMSLLGNPAVMNMAQTFMTNPQVQQMMSGMMTGGAGGASGAGGAGGAGGAAAGGGGLGGIFQAAQQFGNQMQETNPDLFHQMRSQAEEAFGPGGNRNPPEDEEPKKDDTSDEH